LPRSFLFMPPTSPIVIHSLQSLFRILSTREHSLLFPNPMVIRTFSLYSGFPVRFFATNCGLIPKWNKACFVFKDPWIPISCSLASSVNEQPIGSSHLFVSSRSTTTRTDRLFQTQTNRRTHPTRDTHLRIPCDSLYSAPTLYELRIQGL